MRIVVDSINLQLSHICLVVLKGLVHWFAIEGVVQVSSGFPVPRYQARAIKVKLVFIQIFLCHVSRVTTWTMRVTCNPFIERNYRFRWLSWLTGWRCSSRMQRMGYMFRTHNDHGLSKSEQEVKLDHTRGGSRNSGKRGHQMCDMGGGHAKLWAAGI